MTWPQVRARARARARAMVGVKVGRLLGELGGLIFEVGADEDRVEV